MPKHWPSSLTESRCRSQPRRANTTSSSVRSPPATSRRVGKKGFNIDRRKIQLHEPLKTLGEFTVPVKLHKDVTTHLKVVSRRKRRNRYASATRERPIIRAGFLCELCDNFAVKLWILVG